MKKLLLALLALPLFASAQNFHFAARIGMAGYQGDLKSSAAPLSQNHLMGSIGARYDISEHFSARTFLTSTKLRADDKKGTDGMKLRNLNFQSKVLEWEVSGQLNLFSLNNRWWTPYVYAGVGLFRFDPYTKDAAGEKVYLRPLGTEGQGIVRGVNAYKRTQFFLPLGAGFSYSLNEDMRLGIEGGYRLTFTDYIDDVSDRYVDQTALRNARGDKAVELAFRGDEVGNATYPADGTFRGNAEQKDGYYYIAVTYSVRYFFDKYKQIVGLPSNGRSKKVGCPATRGY